MAQKLLGNRYRLLSVLGSGGFGRVWSAYDETLRVEVAIKQVRLEPTATEAERAKLISRAEHEARNAAKLRDHPNVVTVHDVVIVDGAPWLVMRLVKGRSLAQELTDMGRIPVGEAARIAAGILGALSAAHAEGVIHRDVKPGNIMLAEDGSVLLTDFGIAKHETDTAQTSQSQLVGSLAYMAPERLQGQDLPASDLFALGATLYEAIEGASPFARATPIAVMGAVAMEQPAPPLHAAYLSTLILSLLEKDPSQRPDARSALDRVSGRMPPSHVMPVHSAPAATAWAQAPPPPSSRMPRPEPGLPAPPVSDPSLAATHYPISPAHAMTAPPLAVAPASRRRGFIALKWTAAAGAVSLASILIFTKLATGGHPGNSSSQGSDRPSQGSSTQAAGSSGSGLPSSYAGTWTGTATQSNFGTAQGEVNVEVDLTGGAQGHQVGTLSVSYLAAYTCTFDLILASTASNGPVILNAQATNGVCTAAVVVTLQETSATSLRYNTKAANAAQTAERGTLTRA
jgi:serine/threonine protein kinase